ncbi:hypothetical protein sphantq_04563 (plasmid) [Sphingobium sp. AntQ-1]|uniref:DsbA family protein n=1 Tax=Sphingobium sp. AntQ-1 TaxID=2930091 RepID=UPI00234E4238|nr:DsbA family protein [Sphingobium sp. AntQ-1]WCP16067.1 hypothetical protein sphantq_04563 [Sphingobium sp. AntQ-1]
MKRFIPLALLAAVLGIVGFAALRPGSVTTQASAQTFTREAITDDPIAPKFAPKGYDVTIVEFADYNCPYCRRMHPTIAALLASDPKIRIVYRDWPIFGGASVEAARAAIASQWQGKHEAFNAALYEGGGRIDSAAICAAAKRAGVDWTRLQKDLVTHKADIDGLLARTNVQAPALGLQGTPAFLVGPYLLPGAFDLPNLRKAVAKARAHPNGPPKAP